MYEIILLVDFKFGDFPQYRNSPKFPAIIMVYKAGRGDSKVRASTALDAI